MTQLYASKKFRDCKVGFGVVVQYKCTKCSYQRSKYELLQRKLDCSIQTGSEKAKSGSEMANLGSEMAKLGSEMDKLGSEIAKLGS